MRLQETPVTRVNLYVLAVATTGTFALATALRGFRLEQLDLAMLAVLVVLAAVSQRVQIVLFRSSAISVSIAAIIASYVLFGTPVAIFLSLVEGFVNAFTPKRKPLVKIAFNTGAFATSALAGGVAYTFAGGVVRPTDIITTLVAVAIAGAVYFALNSVLTAGVIALSERRNVLTIWRTNYAWMPVNFLATAAQGAALALASQTLGIFGVAIFTLPLAVAWYSFRLYMAKSTEVRQQNAKLEDANGMLRQTNDRLEQSHLSVVGALMGALETRATAHATTAADTVRYSVGVGKRLGCSAEEIAAIKLGALFHDIGTIGVPEHLLAKESGLESGEYEQVKAHTTIGANLLSNVPMLERIRPIVLSHHERYDGTGYPDGLTGDLIPLTAQIIAVADAFQAMTQTRPHRAPMSRKQAIRELRASAGTQFNPVVVEAFISSVIEERRKAARGGAATQHVYQQALEAVRSAI